MIDHPFPAGLINITQLAEGGGTLTSTRLTLYCRAEDKTLGHRPKSSTIRLQSRPGPGPGPRWRLANPETELEPVQTRLRLKPNYCYTGIVPVWILGSSQGLVWSCAGTQISERHGQPATRLAAAASAGLMVIGRTSGRL